MPLYSITLGLVSANNLEKERNHWSTERCNIESSANYGGNTVCPTFSSSSTPEHSAGLVLSGDTVFISSAAQPRHNEPCCVLNYKNDLDTSPWRAMPSRSSVKLTATYRDRSMHPAIQPDLQSVSQPAESSRVMCFQHRCLNSLISAGSSAGFYLMRPWLQCCGLLLFNENLFNPLRAILKPFHSAAIWLNGLLIGIAQHIKHLLHNHISLQYNRDNMIHIKTI